MAIRINTQVSSVNVRNNLKEMQRNLASAFSKLASANRITQAADDAAGLAIGTRMDAQIRSLTQNLNAASDGISIVRTAEGAQSQIVNNLQRARELAVQAGNGALSDADRASIQQEVDGLVEEIDRISQGTEFNGMPLLDGSFSMTVDAGGGDEIEVDIDAMQAASLGVESLDITTPEGVNSTLEAVDAAINEVSASRSELGATQNRFDASIRNIRADIVNHAESKSRIMDTDYAMETARLTNVQIQQQAGLATLGKIHELAPQTVFSLLE